MYIKNTSSNAAHEISIGQGTAAHIMGAGNSTRLMTLKGWQPQEYTKEGKPKVDESVLSKLEYPEAKLLSEYLMINKRIGQLAEGNQAWLKLEKEGKIYGSVNTNGAVTGRCTPTHPNVS